MPPGPSEVPNELCGYASGELRYGAVTVRDAHGACTGDGFCLSRCAQRPTGDCEGGLKCGSSFTTAALTYSRADCVPAGTGVAGAPCAYHAGADGRFTDDCAVDHACVAGTCRRLCSPEGFCISGQTCTTPAGHAPELAVCVPGLSG